MIALSSNGPGTLRPTVARSQLEAAVSRRARSATRHPRSAPGAHQLTAATAATRATPRARVRTLSAWRTRRRPVVSCAPRSVALGHPRVQCDGHRHRLAHAGPDRDRCAHRHGRRHVQRRRPLHTDPDESAIQRTAHSATTPASAGTASPRLSARTPATTTISAPRQVCAEVPATGTPAVRRRSRARAQPGSSVAQLPATRELLPGDVTVAAGSVTLAAARMRFLGGRRRALALTPKAGGLTRLIPGRHAPRDDRCGRPESSHPRDQRSGYCVVRPPFHARHVDIRK